MASGMYIYRRVRVVIRERGEGGERYVDGGWEVGGVKVVGGMWEGCRW